MPYITKTTDKHLGSVTQTGSTWKTGKPPTILPSVNTFVINKHESIMTATKEGGKRAQHDCVHTLHLEKYAMVNARNYAPIDGTGNYHTYRSTNDQAKVHYEHPGLRFPDPPDWDTAWASLMNDAWGMFPGESTLLVNIAEFAEMKNLFKNLKRFLTGRLLTNLRHFLRRRGNDPINYLVNDHLALKFGVMPLIKDSIMAFTAYETCKNRWDVLKQAQGLRTVKGYADFTPVNYSRTYDSSTFPWKQVSATQMQTAKAGITAQCQFVMNPAASVMTTLMLSKLGVINPLVAGWNIIPFSFLVDRIIPIGRALDRISPYKMITGQYLNSPIREVHLSRICTFEKVETQVETDQRGKDPGPGRGQVVSAPGWTYDRTYRRTVGAPVYRPYSLPQIRKFGFDEGTFEYGNTVLEIVYQRLFKK